MVAGWWCSGRAVWLETPMQLAHDTVECYCYSVINVWVRYIMVVSRHRREAGCPSRLLDTGQSTPRHRVRLQSQRRQMGVGGFEPQSPPEWVVSGPCASTDGYLTALRPCLWPLHSRVDRVGIKPTLDGTRLWTSPSPAKLPARTPRAMCAVPSPRSGFCPVRGVIRSRHGLIGVMDRAGLEPASPHRDVCLPVATGNMV